MKYRLKVVSPLGTFHGKDIKEWDEKELEQAKLGLTQLIENPAYLSIDTDKDGYLILASDVVKNSILCIEQVK